LNDKRVKKVGFASESVRDAYFQLKSGRFEEKQLYGFIERAIADLKENPLCGIGVPRQVWPKDYVRDYGIDNLRKYDLPNGWRLTYTLKGSTVEIVSVILEWFSHKEYEKRFKYNVK
jgi:hypothetical protein